MLDVPDEFKHLTKRLRYALCDENCTSFRDAAKLHRGEWLRRANFGVKSVAELECELASRGLEFGMDEVKPLPMDEASVLHRRLDMAFGLIKDLQDQLARLRKAIMPTTAAYLARQQLAEDEMARLAHE